MELREKLLAHRPLAFQRLLVPPGLVEPDQRGGKIDKSNPPFAGHLQGRQRAIGDRFLPMRGT